MWCFFCMIIGIIGNGNHSKRIQKILKNKKKIFIIYKPKAPNYFDKKEFDKIKKCKTIFITSPNKTHYFYIKKLWLNRYLFCEKPPVVKKNELIFLKSLSHKKIYFNFNFRFSMIAKIIANIKNYNLGKLIYINKIVTHGLALKDDYKKNWRSNKMSNQYGIFEMVLIHYLDLINYFYKVKKIKNLKMINISQNGTSYDTCKLSFEIGKNLVADFYATYSSPLYKKFLILFTNGYIEQIENKIFIYGPAKNLDKNGLFKKPKIIKQYKLNQTKDYQNSLEESIHYFLDHSDNKKTFNKKMFIKSLESTSLMINGKNY